MNKPSSSPKPIRHAVFSGITSFKEGDLVKAAKVIEFPDFGKQSHRHADIGDLGEVVGVDDGTATVRFQPSGTATIVADDEISLR